MYSNDLDDLLVMINSGPDHERLSPISQKPISSSTQFAQISVSRARRAGEGGSMSRRFSKRAMTSEQVTSARDSDNAEPSLTHQSLDVQHPGIPCQSNPRSIAYRRFPSRCMPSQPAWLCRSNHNPTSPYPIKQLATATSNSVRSPCIPISSI